MVEEEEYEWERGIARLEGAGRRPKESGTRVDTVTSDGCVLNPGKRGLRFSARGRRQAARLIKTFHNCNFAGAAGSRTGVASHPRIRGVADRRATSRNLSLIAFYLRRASRPGVYQPKAH